MATIFTEVAGLQAYVLKGVRSSKAGNKMALIQPLTILDLVVYHKETSTSQHIREIKCHHVYKSIPQDLTKKTIAFFIAEILNRAVKEQSHPEELYHFLERALISLDEMNNGKENFHLIFLIQLSRQLGFGPGQWSEITNNRSIASEDADILQKLLSNESFHDNLSGQKRREILNLLLDFYKDHIDQMGKIRSVEVLREILA